MRNFYLLGFPLFFLIGCASTEVNYNAIDVASTYDTLIIKQVVFNLLKTEKDEYSIPAFVKIGTQTTATSDTVSPTFATPFSATTTLSQTAASILTGKTLATAGSGLNLQVQANRQQNYTLSPVGDPDQLRRLRAIYQYAAGRTSDFDFESNYPIISVSGTSTAQSPNTVVSGKFAGNSFTVSIGGDKPGQKTQEPIYLRRFCSSPGERGCEKYSFSEIRPDKTFISLPGCVMCDLHHHKDGTPKNAFVLEKNPNLRGLECPDAKPYNEETPCTQALNNNVLFYEPGSPHGVDAISIPTNGLEPFYVRGTAGIQAFYELVLFSQEAASQGTGSPSSGGQSDGRKTPALQTFSGPGASLTTGF